MREKELDLIIIASKNRIKREIEISTKVFTPFQNTTQCKSCNIFLYLKIQKY